MNDPVREASHPFHPADPPVSERSGGDGLPSAAPYQVDAVEVEVDRQALRESALRQARRLVDFYRISASELLAAAESSAQAGRCGADSTVAAPALPVKYRHPVSGETWDGQGPHPQWMRQALLQDGFRVVDLKVADTDF